MVKLIKFDYDVKTAFIQLILRSEDISALSRGVSLREVLNKSR